MLNAAFELYILNVEPFKDLKSYLISLGRFLNGPYSIFIFKKYISLKNFSGFFHLWYYPVDIRFTFSRNCRTEYRIIPNLASVRSTTDGHGSYVTCTKNILKFRWKQNLQMYIVVVGMWCILKWISVQLYSNFK